MNEEEELKEELERYERQNQEAYDEVTKGNEELKRRQEEKKKKGLLDEGSAFRQTAAIGTEVGLNTLLDLFSFEPGSQIAGGSAINYLAQRIRGGEFSKGEMIASGLASLIPGGAQGTALARTAKGIGKGAVSGAVETTGMTTIDEGRLPTAEELATGAGIGGAFGGLFTTAANTQQIKELAQRVKGGVSNLSDEFMAPFRVAFRGDLIGAVADGTGTSSATRRINNPNDPNNILAPYRGHLTNKFAKQPWEDYVTGASNQQSVDRLLTNLTGAPSKLDAPQPKGFVYRLLKSKGKTGKLTGNQPLVTAKQDIDLTTKEFKFNTAAQAQKSADSFRRKIIRMMQIDRIRGEDAGTLAGFNKGSSKITTAAGGIKDVGDTYYDYLTGFFNRYIRRGTVDNFDQAIKIKIPKVKGKQILPGIETDIVKGDASLIRELRLFTINPDVYKSGAFSTQNPTYQSKLKTLIRKYSTANVTQPNASMTYNKRKDIFEYKFDAHHINQIAEGWPLFRGLPKEEIPLMRKLIEEYGLEVGNAEGNMLLILNKFHKEYHDIYWPKAYAKLKAHPDGWDIDKIREIQTASGRMTYAKRYVDAINESREEVLASVQKNLDELAAEKNKLVADLTEAEINQIDIDFENLGDDVPEDILAQMAEDIGINDVSRWTNYDR